MAVAEQQLSPEEKLLKVIQSNGEVKQQPTPEEKPLPAAQTAGAVPSAAPRPEPSAKAAEPQKPAAGGEKKAVTAVAPEEKPKLKVMKSGAAPDGKEPAKAMIGAPASGVIGAGGPGASAAKGHPGRKLSMGVVNEGLAAAVILILALTGYEIWAAVRDSGIRSQKVEVRGQAPKEVGAPVQAEDMLPLASLVDAWKEKDIFPGAGGESAKRKDEKGRPTQPGPEAPGRLKLMGFSRASEGESKAILWDTTENRMFILRTGEKILVGEQQLELVQIKDDQVVLSDGRESITVK